MKPFWKWLIGICVLLLSTLFIGLWYFGRHWKPIIDSQLRSAIVQASDSLYQITYDDLAINLLTGDIKLNNFKLQPDSQVYSRLKKIQSAPDNTYNIHVNLLIIKQFKLKELVFNKQLIIDDIIFDKPNIHLTNEYHPYNDTIVSKDKKSIYQKLSSTLNKLHIEHIFFRHIDFKFTKIADSTEHITELSNINLHIKDILIDSLSQFDTTRFYHTRGIELDMPGTQYYTSDSLYTLSFDHLNISTTSHNNKLLLTGLTYAPRVNKADFYRIVKRAKDRFDVRIDTIQLEYIDLQRFMRRQHIYAKKLSIYNGSAAISNDLRRKRIPRNHIGNAPHQQIMRLGQILKIDSASIRDIDISYAEVGSKTGKEGKITFNRTSGNMYNISNDTSALKYNKHMLWNMTSYMMNQGKLSVIFNFDMLAPNGTYAYNGKLGPMNGKSLNQIILPLLNVEVTSADVKGVKFDVNATDTHAKGTLLFDYENLKATIKSEADEEGERSSKGLVTFVANQFILNSSNPDANGVYHEGPINFSRPKEFSFWKYTWHSLLDGIKPAVGVSAEREQRLQNTAESVKNTTEKTGSFLRGIFNKKKQNTESD